MRIFSRVLLIGLIITCPNLVKADKTKQALKALEAGELSKTEEIIKKSIEKEGLTPGISYVYSKLFLDKSYDFHNVDSAHFYVLEALSLLDGYDSRELEQFVKLGIEKSEVHEQSAIVDSLAYDEYQAANNIEKYNDYLINYVQSRFVDQVLLKRNSLAFQEAMNEDTWQAYELFMNKYPESVDHQEATNRYDRLLFEEHTGSGEISDLKSFLRDHPNSPFRKDVEENIFNQVTYYPDSLKMLDDMSLVKSAALRFKVANLLYYLEMGRPLIAKLLAPDDFMHFQDSIMTLEALNGVPWVPILENGLYGFGDDVLDIKLDFRYSGVDEDYLCGGITEDFLDVVIGEDRKLVNRSGTVVYQGRFDAVEDMGLGMLKITTGGKTGVIHKTGTTVLEPIYSEVEILGHHLLKFSKSGKTGLAGLNGSVLLESEFDDIFTEGAFWVFEKGGDLAISSFDQVIMAKDGQIPDLNFKYEEVELIDDEFLVCFAEDREIMFNSNLEIVVPEGVQRIITKFETWVVKQPFGYRVFNKDLGELTHTLYDLVLQNDEWLALMKNTKWSVFNKGIDDDPIIGLDSVKLLGNDIAMIFRGLRGMAIFPNKKVVEFTEGELLRSLSSGRKTDVHFLTIERKGKTLLYRNGELLFETEYRDIGYIYDSAFYVKEGGKYGAVGIDGRLIMRIRYSAIGEAVNGIAPVLYRGKFGGYNFNDKIMLKLDYSEKMSSYNKDLLVTTLDSKKGLLNVRNNVILNPHYDDIVFWTDSLALAKLGEEWSVLDIYNGGVLDSLIQDYEYILNDTEKVLKIRTQKGYGVLSNTRGLLIRPTYSDLINLGTSDAPIYFGEKRVAEADFYVVVYMNAEGESIRSQAFRSEEYTRIVCE